MGSNSDFTKIYHKIILRSVHRVRKLMGDEVPEDAIAMSKERIQESYNQYREIIKKSMTGQRINRHKIASCICLAIIESRPFNRYFGEGEEVPASHYILNECLAVDASLALLLAYMKDDIKGIDSITELDFPEPAEHESPVDFTLIYLLMHLSKKEEMVTGICNEFTIGILSQIFFFIEEHNKNILSSNKMENGSHYTYREKNK